MPCFLTNGQKIKTLQQFWSKITAQAFCLPSLTPAPDQQREHFFEQTL